MKDHQNQTQKTGYDDFFSLEAPKISSSTCKIPTSSFELFDLDYWIKKNWQWKSVDTGRIKNNKEFKMTILIRIIDTLTKIITIKLFVGGNANE